MNDLPYPPVVRDRYRLGDKLGEGGMGAVFRCTDLITGEEHAIKFLTVDQLLSKSGVQRFIHEARLLTHLRHPNIVAIHDFGVEEGLPYLIMELCLDASGRAFTLKNLQEMAPEHRLAAPELIKLIPQILGAVARIHDQGLIHRDLKPENFLLKPDDHGRLVPKLSDFGLVALTGDLELQRRYELSISISLQESVVKERAWVGTYAYMSPEQKRGEQLDASSDVYSLGLLLYRLGTGYERINPELPSEVNPELPAWLDRLVEKALADHPGDRWLTAAKMLEQVPQSLRPAPRKRLARRRTPQIVRLTAIVVLLLSGLAIVLHQHFRRPAANAPRPQPAVAAPAEATPKPRGPAQLTDDDPARREAARQRLRMTPDHAIAAVTEALTGQGDSQREAAVFAGELADPRLVTVLTAALRTPASPIRREASEALAQIGAPAVPALGGLLQSDDPAVRAYAQVALSRLGAIAWPAWLTALTSPHPAVVEQASSMLIRIGEPALPALFEQLASPAPDETSAAMAILLAIGEPAADAATAALAHPHPGVRAGAATILGDRRRLEAAAAMTELLKDASPHVRRQAQLALIKLGEAAAVPLVRVFRDADAEVCAYAANALAAIGKPALPSLMRAMEADVPSVRERIADVLVRIGDEAVGALIDALRGHDPEVRRHAADALVRLHSDVAIRAMLDLLNDADPNARTHAVYALNKLDLASVPALVKLLGDESVPVHRTAQQVLVQLGMAGVPQVAAALESAQATVRIRAAEVLVKLQAVDTFPAIVRALDDRRGLDEALAALRDPRLDEQVLRRHLERQFTTTDAAERQRLQAQLLSVGAPAVPALVRVLQSSPSHHAAAAAALLGQFANSLALPPLVRALREDSERFPVVNIAAANALGELRHPAAVAPLSQALRWNHVQLRTAAMLALGQIGDETAIPVLDRALGDKENQVRAAAAEALGMIGTAASVAPLRRAAVDPNAHTRNTAIEALRRIEQAPRR